MGTGRYADALTVIRPLVETNIPGWTCQALSVAVEAAIRTDDRDLAERCLHQLHERSTAAGNAWGLGLNARSHALVATSGDTAEALYLDAIAHHEGTSIITELPHTRLLYGEWLRRQGRRQDARAQLKVANDAFSTMGAEAFARRARAELAATGERVRRRTVETESNLTPQEAQVARLAAAGATNPEIAAKLFISANTVDYHLRKIYRKLGISSRRQLASLELYGRWTHEPTP